MSATRGYKKAVQVEAEEAAEVERRRLEAATSESDHHFAAHLQHLDDLDVHRAGSSSSSSSSELVPHRPPGWEDEYQLEQVEWDVQRLSEMVYFVGGGEFSRPLVKPFNGGEAAPKDLFKIMGCNGLGLGVSVTIWGQHAQAFYMLLQRQ